HKTFCDLIMGIIWSSDGDEIDTVFALSFFLRHLTVIGIHPALISDAPFPCRHKIFLLISGKTSGRQHRQIVHHRTMAVHISDKSAVAASYHAKFQFHCNNLLSKYLPTHFIVEYGGFSVNSFASFWVKCAKMQ